jgi:hypothetical protein
MDIDDNENIKAYASELPAELKRAIVALSDDICLAILFLLFKYGKMSFSEIIAEFGILPYNSIRLMYYIKELQKSSLIKTEYFKEENEVGCIYYDVSGFGESILNNLLNAMTD